MFFDSEKPRKFLEENGFAVTFMTFNYKRWSRHHAKFHEDDVEKFIGLVVVCNIKDVFSCEDIEPFVELSSFSDVDEWVAEIRRLDNIELPFRGGFKKLGNLCFVAKI